VLALLAARFGNVDLADDCVQDALVQAVETWGTAGVPSNPAGWLYTVAHNRIIDRLRREAVAARRLRAAAVELTASPDEGDEFGEDEEVDMTIVENTPVGDEQLRLMLLCCHPSLDRDTQVALTLRLVGGLTTPEIAAAFLVPEATLAQRIVRAKRKIRDARIPLSVPSDLDERVDALLTVLYLVFNEGYLARGGGPDAVRVSLVDEAVRLTGLAIELLPGNPEVSALLALELYHRSRLGTRLDGAGDIVLLADQDRTRWDGALIGEANGILKRALRGGHDGAGPYQLQALIASQHANAPTAADTDWVTIAALYGHLMDVAGSPVVALNRAVAVAMADGPGAGLALLDELAAGGSLEGYHLYWASRGELLARVGDRDAARAAFVRARGLTANAAEQRHLDRRIAGV
jgi:RNA polymerase sigma-70 factor (ECF subfamily)